MGRREAGGKRRGGKRDRARRPPDGASSAAGADRHALYERAVQDPAEEAQLLASLFRSVRGREALSLREDFCGTAALCAAWVATHPERTALGVDLDRETLEWGEKHRVLPLGEAAQRVTLACGDVRSYAGTAVDLVAAMNFSYSLLHARSELVAYFAKARAALRSEGVFVIDVHAGPDAQLATLDETDCEDFTYVWEQQEMDAWSGRARRAIHFYFEDGSSLENAFEYDFRIWTLPELRDALEEAGFSRIELWTEDFDEEGFTVGALERKDSAHHEESWIPYVVGLD